MSCGVDIMFATRNLIRHFMCFGLSYFLYDVYAMCYAHNDRCTSKSFLSEKWLLVAHHIILPCVW